MKQRQFIKVVATAIEGTDGGRLISSAASGIVALKRGQTLIDHVTLFLGERGITSFALHQRGNDTWATSPIMFLNQEPKQVFTFNFTIFDQDHLGFYAKSLKAKELERDMKILKRFLNA